VRGSADVSDLIWFNFSFLECGTGCYSILGIVSSGFIKAPWVPWCCTKELADGSITISTRKNVQIFVMKVHSSTLILRVSFL
jgi:hypothetical protein